MSGYTWIRSLRLLMLPAIVLCMWAPSFGTISFSSNTLTYSSTSDLSSTIDPSGQKDVTNSYGVSKASFQALSPQIVAFDSAPTASQTLRTLVAKYDATNTVTFTFPSAMYNYGSVTTSGRGSFSGSNARHAISTVPTQPDSLYDWFDATITSTGGRGVQSLGFCVGFRSDQAVSAGQALFTLSDSTTGTVTLPALGGSGNPEYIFIGYTAPSGKTITRIQAARTSLPGGGYVSIDDLSFVMSADTTAPAAVSNLSCSNLTTTSVQLNWTAPGDDGSTGTATSYDIRYSTSAINAGNFSSATAVTGVPAPAAAGTNQNVTVSGLTADTTYYFAMKTADEVPNWSAISNLPNAHTVDSVAPAAVSNLATGSITASSITLSWTAPGDNGSSGIATTYDIRYSTSTITTGNFASATAVASPPAPAAAGTNQNVTVSGLSGDTTYYFAMKTADEVPNWSTISNVPSAKTSDTVAPAAVSNLATSSPTGTSITLSWTAPGDNGSTGTATTYDIRYSTSTITAGNFASATAVTGVPAPQVAGTNQNVVVSGLSPNTTYYFAMKTADEVPNWSAISNVPGGTTADSVAPAAVSNLATSNPTSSSITLSWTAPGDDGSTGTATSYDIRYSTSPIDAGNWVSATQVTGEPAPAAAGTNQNMVVSGLLGGTTYYFAIKTSDEVPNTSAISNSPSGTTSAASGSTIVALKRDSGLTAGGATDARFDGATVRTANVADAVIYAASESRWMNGGAATSAYGDYTLYKFDLSSIPAGATINLAQLRVYHTAGNGGAGNGDVSMVLTHAWSEGAGSYSYPGATPGVSFAHPSGTNTGPSQNATGGGTAPLQTWGTGNNSFFDITVDAGWSIAPSSAPSGTGYHVIDVTSHVQQWVGGIYPNYGWAQIRGYWDFYMSEAGTAYEPVLFIDYLGDTTPPAAVTNLATSNPTTSSMTLTWTAPGDDGNTGTAANYDVRYSTSPISESNWASATQVTGEPTPSVAGTNQTMVVNDLSAGTTYYFAIKTSDEIPNISAISNIASGTTSAGGGSTIVALKRDSGLTAGGATDARFDGATVRTVNVADAEIYAASESRWMNGGASASAYGDYTLYKFDLSSISAGTTINLAQLRLYHTMGNGGAGNGDVSMVLTHAWSEGAGSYSYPGATAGVSFAHPSGTNTGPSQNATGGGTAPLQTWGTGNDSFFSITADAGSSIAPSSAPAGTGYHVIDVTSHVQQWVSGIHPNYGWAQLRGYWDFYMSEAGTAYEPVLFIDYSGDTTAPAAMTNLATSNATSSSITLTWTAPGNDGSTGTAASYDIRYRTGGAIDASNWASATQCTGEPAPLAAGSNQSFVVTGLSSGTTYYFAIKTADEVPNWSGLSNSPSGTTTSGGITPAGTIDTSTQGAWRGVYGADGYILFSFSGTAGGPGTDVVSLPSYVSSYSTSLARWLWATNTSEPTDLQPPSGSNRSLGCVYTDTAGTITLIPSQTKDFTLRLYLSDRDTNQRWDNLSFTGASLTGTDSIQCTLSKWVSYPVHATLGTNVVINLQWQAGINSVISAILFDSTSGPDTTAPAAVTNLATSNPTPSSITLTWTAPGDDGSTGTATSYDIRYRTGGAVNDSNWASATQVSGEPSPQIAGSNQSMVITGLSPSTTYYFAIKTSDEVPNTSAISNSPSGTTGAADTTPPAAVTNLATSAPTSSSITLTWTAPGDDGNTGTASTYDIRYRTGGAIDASNWATATQATGEPTPLAAGNNQTFVVNGLSPSTTYYFAIKTADEIPNWSGLSNSPSGTTTAPGASAKIALKRDAGLVSGGSIDARFNSATVVTATVQDAQIWGTQTSRWHNGGITTVSAGGGTGPSWVVYKFDLVAVPAYAHINLAQLRLNASGEYGTSSLAMIYTHDWVEGTQNYTFPGAAGGVTYWAPVGYNTYYDQNPSGGTTQPWGAWGPNSDSGLDMAVDGGPIINPSPQYAGYYVYDVTAHVQTWVRGGRPNFGWVQLDYSCFSLSESGSNTQPVLFIDYALEGDTTPPATIANLATSNVTNRSVTLSWTAPGDDGSTGTASGYEVRYATSPITAASWALATPVTGVPAPQSAGTGQSMTIDGLVGNTTYYFAIKASDEMPNVTPISNVASATTSADTIAPAAVSNLAAGSATNHSLTLTWTAPGDDGSSTGTATTYDIRYSTSTINAGNWDNATQVTGEPAPAAAGTNQSLVIDNLTQNTTYYFAMKTSDEVPNTSGLSNVASGQVLADTIAPGTVTNLTVTKTKSSALRLAWIASGDDGAEGTATSYDVRYRTGGAVTEANWASCTQVTGEPVPVQPGYHRNMWIYGLSSGTTYYIGVKALDEVLNASTIATASATTPAASNLTRPLIQPDDLEFLGAFKMPQGACGYSTSGARAGLAVRRVNGNLQFLTCTHVYADGVYECDFPGWGADQGTWPQSTLLHEWGMAVYGTPSVKPSGACWTAGLNYDQATGRLYYSYGDIYYVTQTNVPSLGCAVLNGDGSVTVVGPWLSQNVSIQVMRGGNLTIPDWFADTYVGGRKLGVGFGGPWSGWASCSPGPALAAAHHPASTDTELDTIRLLQYDHTWPDHWAKRDGGYWWRDGVPVYDCHLPDGDIGYWTSFDSCTGIWVDLPDKQGLLYMTSKGYGGQWYDYGAPDSERYENWWRVYDPADLADVAQSIKNPWDPQHDEWKVQGIPDPVNHAPIVCGVAFDAQSRTLFVLAAYAYQYGVESYPVVYGYHIRQ